MQLPIHREKCDIFIVFYRQLKVGMKEKMNFVAAKLHLMMTVIRFC